jgi:hypothetical protein
LGNPRDAGLGLGTLNYTVDWGRRHCSTRCGPCS